MSDIEDEVHFDSADSGDEWGPNQEDELSELEDVYADNNDVIELESEDDLSEQEISSFVDKQFYSAKNGTVWSTKPTYNAQMPAHREIGSNKINNKPFYMRLIQKFFGQHNV